GGGAGAGGQGGGRRGPPPRGAGRRGGGGGGLPAGTRRPRVSHRRPHRDSSAASFRGYGGGVPPNAGQSAWWSHQAHSRLGLGRKSPVCLALLIAAQIACRVRSNRRSSSASGV